MKYFSHVKKYINLLLYCYFVTWNLPLLTSHNIFTFDLTEVGKLGYS